MKRLSTRRLKRRREDVRTSTIGRSTKRMTMRLTKSAETQTTMDLTTSRKKTKKMMKKR